MKIKKLIALSLSALTLASCGTKTYQTSDYRKELAYKDNFTIAQLTDIHWGIEMDYEAEVKHLDEIVAKMKANNTDLIVITGDSFLFANKNIVKKFINYFDNTGIKWTYTYGNHDNQGDYDHYYINKQLMKAKNIVFVDYEDDDVFGLTNFYINLKQGNDTLYRLYILDSNSYHNKGAKYGYDIIHQDQLDHMKNISNNENDNATSLVFLHIPTVEYTEAYDGYEAGTYEGQGVRNEHECPGYINSGAYDVFKSINVKGVFSGHDHINTYDVNYKNEMILSYGLKVTDIVYHDNDLMGYQQITLPSNPADFSLDCIKEVTVKYE